MFRSEAESIYQAWNTSTARRSVTPQSRAVGTFDTFRTNGFDVLVNRLSRVPKVARLAEDRRAGLEVAREV